ncbi:MAG: ROK family protein, partial [Cytophagaceae bacterium]|nr:ROK family protein [Cytophagaceae bacterium]
DRKNVILLPNIPNVKNLPIVDILGKNLPGLKVKIENDAKCATLGEFYFGENKGIENFVFITLGTGVGGGAVIHKELFIGARGNGMEVGHMIARNGKTLEQQIGLQRILEYAKDTIGNATDTNLNKAELTMHALVAAASTGDVYAKRVFAFVGETLGETLVSIVRVLDVDTILIGGGISAAFEYLVPEAISVMKVNLPPYYTDNLQIKKASLSNDAGILGAAGLILHEHQTW